jgi:alkylation response protein AidB-like acyl-CoA dehydrogenase
MAATFISDRNIRFLLYDLFKADALTRHPHYGMHNKKTFDMVIDAALRMARELCLPVLHEMDQNPFTFEDGRVRVHERVRRFMQESGDGGWIAARFPLDHEGEQLPSIITGLSNFIFAAANYSLSVYPALTAGAAQLITSFASDDLIETYVPRMLAGEWQGTMALTEPQAGSSLSDILTEAVPQGNGTYRIKGQKVFISGGDHDGVDNVVHLLLAKITGGPAGVKGISLFVVPRQRPTADGSLIPNDVAVSQVFHKLGYRGCPICELVFGQQDDCHGFLVGEPHRGLAYMFKMMNGARIEVGAGAAAIAQAAYCAALGYARQRPQGRLPEEKDPARPQVPIIEHADVKRMLLFQRAVVEGSLALILQCLLYEDFLHTTEGEERERYSLLLDLLTPVVKTYPSETGLRSVSSSLQCLGGYGYCEDFPLEQYYRDIRIHPIHEGTTGIQGMDLLGRKVVTQQGRALMLFFAEVQGCIDEAGGMEALSPLAQQLADALRRLQETTLFLTGERLPRGPAVFLADATLYLEMFGIITIAWQWLRQAVVAAALVEKCRKKKERDFYRGKLQTCRYFFAYELPRIRGLAETLHASDALTLEMEPAWFSD